VTPGGSSPSDWLILTVETAPVGHKVTSAEVVTDYVTVVGTHYFVVEGFDDAGVSTTLTSSFLVTVLENPVEEVLIAEAAVEEPAILYVPFAPYLAKAPEDEYIVEAGQVLALPLSARRDGNFEEVKVTVDLGDAEAFSTYEAETGNFTFSPEAQHANTTYEVKIVLTDVPSVADEPALETTYTFSVAVT